MLPLNGGGEYSAEVIARDVGVTNGQPMNDLSSYLQNYVVGYFP